MKIQSAILTSMLALSVSMFSSLALAEDASISIDCGDVTYTVSTSGKDGSCAIVYKEKKISCGDSEGNLAQASCEEGCGEDKGNGDCSKKTNEKDED